MSRTMTPSAEGAYWYWSEALPEEPPILLCVSRCCDDGMWVATECLDGFASQYVADLPGTWEGPLRPHGEAGGGWVMQLDQYRECLRLGRHDQADAWTRVIQPDDSQYDVCRSCGFLRQRAPDLAAMKRAFVAAWPSLRDWRLSITGQRERVARDLPDAPFLAALQAARGERP